MDRKEYFSDYHKENYISDTSKRDSKTRNTFGKLLVTLAYTSKLDSGKHFKVEMTNDNDLNDLLFEGWSDALVVNQDALVNTIGITRKYISKYLQKAIDEDYLRLIGKYRIEKSKFDSNVYMVNVSKISNDFFDIWFEEYQYLGNLYYHNLEIKDSKKDKVKLNNNCMKQALWQEVKNLIDNANLSIPEKFRIKFLTKDENGDYHDSRYYSSQLCKSLNPEKHPESDRYDLLKERFGIDEEFEEIDINSMMLRSSYNLINEEYLGIDEDIYYKLYLLIVDDLVQNKLSIETFKYSKARDYIKTTIMSIYMDPRSVYCKINDKCDSELNVVKDSFVKEEIETLFNISYEEFLVRLKEALYKFLSVYDFNGDLRIFLGQMFFKYEACIYYYMNSIFSDMGIISANVYDGFYFVKGTCTKELFYEVYHKAIDLTKELLKKHNHSLVDIYGKTFNLKLLKPYSNTKKQKNVEIIEKFDNVELSVKPIDIDKQNEHINELKAKGEKYEF